MSKRHQAIGRVLRHRDDYGCIFLLDSRYDSSDIREMLPEFFQPNVGSTTLKGQSPEKEWLAIHIARFFARMSGGATNAMEEVLPD